METRCPAAAEKRDSAWSFRRGTGLRHMALKSGLPRVSEFFNGHAELPRKRNRLSDRRLGRALFPRRERLTANAHSHRQRFLTKRVACSHTSDSAELGEAVHVPQMVTRADMMLALSHISRVCLTFLKSGVTLAERGPRCVNSRPRGQTLNWRADEMTVTCLGPVSLAPAEAVVRAGADVKPSSNAAAAQDQP